ncbi:hypothetical protein [Specibacter cremeus]|uniref:hypothetical protein n=1 Tax=Specibacter cremeus TaxID=1629051 RepID=UPI000F7B77CE|nr:hypothetical protein [Specibacter cremeus]
MGFSISNAALRLVSGAFILNSGLNKRHLSDEHAAGLQTAAARVIPPVAQMPAATFGKLLGGAEIGIGCTLLLPFVPSRLAGLVLAGFSGGLVATYLRSPGMTEPDRIRPTAAGTAFAKDFWLAGIAAALLFHRKNK